ncbi:alpha/beta fold hydrolase [Streptomyces bauhiniae]|uniref:alpha/beta fold hydrolase n=1 Tax=Streptomyces bauhiniae TaxID=2340725 RepID=UPI0035E1369F
MESQSTTVVLIHGAFADSSCWNPVIALLPAETLRVRSFANPLRGIPDDARALRAFLSTVDGPIVLVGHSYGGAVITEAGAGHPDVRALVYVSAFIPEKDEVLGELFGRFPGSLLPQSLETFEIPGPDGIASTELTVSHDRYREVLAADVEADASRLLAIAQRPLNATAFDTCARAAAWRALPTWNYISQKDNGLPVALQRFQAERAGAFVEEGSTSHMALVSRPARIAALITDAAERSAE